MSEVKIEEWAKGGKNLSQVYKMGLEYAFVSEDMRQCHPFVLCKDFLQDAMWAMLNGKQASIFGFTYSAKTRPPLCLTRTRLALTNSSDKQFSEKIPNVLDFVNQFCEKLGLRKSLAVRITNPTKKYVSCGVWLFDGSERWQHAPPMLSMYSLLLRVGFGHVVGKDCITTIDNVINHESSTYAGEDEYQLGEAKDSIDKIVKFGYRKFFYIDNKKNYPENVDIDSMHDCSGICSMSEGLVPYWNRKSLKKLGATK